MSGIENTAWHPMLMDKANDVLDKQGEPFYLLDNRPIGVSYQGVFDESLKAPTGLLVVEARDLLALRQTELEEAFRHLTITRYVGSTSINIEYSAELQPDFDSIIKLEFAPNPISGAIQVHRKFNSDNKGIHTSRTLKNAEAKRVGNSFYGILPTILDQIDKERQLVNDTATQVVNTGLLSRTES